MLPIMCRAMAVISSIVDGLDGNASRPTGNAMDAVTAEMGAMRPLRHVAVVSCVTTSDVPMGNASGPT